MANSAEFEIFNVRLPIGTMERIHRYRDYLNRTQPGIEATASTAGRMLLSERWNRLRGRWASQVRAPPVGKDCCLARSGSR